MTTAGDISNTSGAAVGSGNQAQNTTINLSNSTIREIQLELLNEIARLSNQIDRVNERISSAIQQTNVRVYELGKAAERQQARNENERHTGHAEHAEQHDEINTRMQHLETLLRESAERRDVRMNQIADLARIAADEARSTAIQARQFQFVIGAAVIAIMVAMFVLVGALGRIQGWW